MYVSWDTCNYIDAAAILDLWLPVSSDSVTDCTIEKFDTENLEMPLEFWSKMAAESM